MGFGLINQVKRITGEDSFNVKWREPLGLGHWPCRLALGGVGEEVGDGLGVFIAFFAGSGLQNSCYRILSTSYIGKNLKPSFGFRAASVNKIYSQ